MTIVIYISTIPFYYFALNSMCYILYDIDRAFRMAKIL
jgi:hypothetical protein